MSAIAALPDFAARARRMSAADRDQRVQLSMSVVLELAPGRSINAKIDNVSLEGCRIHSDALLHVGQKIRVRMPREIVSCEVRWADGLTAGGAFERVAKDCSA